MKLNCIIIDDEPRAIFIMKEYVEKVGSLSLLNTFRNPVKALDYINNNNVHLVFLDINMPNLSGIQFIKSLTKKPQIILTTAYSEYAVESYQLDVTDYLLKPIEFDRFIKSINKVYDNLGKPTSLPNHKNSCEVENSEKEEKDYFFVKNGAKIDRIDLNSILYIEGSGNYILYQLENRKVLVLGKMSDAINALPKNKFVRIHKSHIVQLNKIKAIEDNYVIIEDTRLSISKTYRAEFYAKINSKK